GFAPYGSEPRTSSPLHSWRDRNAWSPPAGRPCRKSSCARQEGDSLLSYANRGGSLSHSYEGCPIKWTDLVAVLREQIKFRIPQSRTGIFAPGHTLIKPFHQCTGEGVVSAPQARYNRL